MRCQQCTKHRKQATHVAIGTISRQAVWRVHVFSDVVSTLGREQMLEDVHGIVSSRVQNLFDLAGRLGAGLVPNLPEHLLGLFLVGNFNDRIDFHIVMAGHSQYVESRCAIVMLT
jgi:hypothetical protein